MQNIATDLFSKWAENGKDRGMAQSHSPAVNQILDKTSSDFLAIHPMPMNIGVEISKEASENSKFKYIEQLSFGVPSRIASYLYGLGEI